MLQKLSVNHFIYVTQSAFGMKKRSLIVFILFAVLIGAAILFIYTKWNKAPESIENAEAVRINAADLFREFSENEQQATQTYNGKVLEITGIVSSIAMNQEGKTIVQLQTNDPLFGINCTMEKESSIKEGQNVIIKGVCSGFTTDVILIRCYLINKTT
ncbi:OB-fold protein [Lacibacter sp. H407]|uniref:OB-fold protein n=1 Tax=Lacibacter sp. H407 TaxID=3133423 RepID=UPI0030BAA43F